MDDCDAAVTAAVVAYRYRKQKIDDINQVALVLGLLDVEGAIIFREHTCSLYNVRRTAVTPSVQIKYQVHAVGSRLHSTICMARWGLRTAFVWWCKSKTIEDDLLSRHGCK